MPLRPVICSKITSCVTNKTVCESRYWRTKKRTHCLQMLMDWTTQGGTPRLMGSCIEQLKDEVLTFVNVRSHRSVIPVPISALHYRDIGFKKGRKKNRGAWKWTDKDQDKEEPWPTPLPLENPLRVSQGELSKYPRVEMLWRFQLFKAALTADLVFNEAVIPSFQMHLVRRMAAFAQFGANAVHRPERWSLHGEQTSHFYSEINKGNEYIYCPVLFLSCVYVF